MTTQSIIYTFLGFTLLLMISACGASAANPDDGTLLIGMAQANNAEPWRTAMNDQIAAAATKHDNLEVIFTDAAQNNAKQIEDIRGLVAQGIDLLIVSPNEAAPLTPVVAEVYQQGIPVIVLDRKVNGDAYTMWIGADNQLIGQKAGEYVANWCNEQQLNPCNIIELRGLEGSTPATERGDGFRAGIAGNSAATIVASQNADWVEAKAPALTNAMLETNPETHVVYAHNDPMAEGALRAARELDLDLDELLIIGIDALPTETGGIRSVLENRIDVTYVYPTGGAEAIDWAMRILTEGTTPPREVVLDTLEVTADNASAVLTRFGGTP